MFYHACARFEAVLLGVLLAISNRHSATAAESLAATHDDTIPCADLPGSENVVVITRVFSGTQDPTFKLSAAEALAMSGTALTTEPLPSTYLMGFRGFELHFPANCSTSQQQWSSKFFVHPISRHSSLTLAKSASNRGYLSSSVTQHILERTGCLESALCVAGRNTVSRASSPHAGRTDVLRTSCKHARAPIVGPDAWNQTLYDPTQDDCGFFVAHQSENNCYNYANNVATDSFAQPGRGTGHKWEENTCESVKDAAARDGLKWMGSDLPSLSEGPADGHYVALYIWPNTNFHWARMDYDVKTVAGRAMRWSHKPGGTEVRDVDNDGKAILDPSTANLSPWSQFCGYMKSVPSHVKIN
ncbi:hypothetical protein CYMTET_35867 [Cymbomonas tetramitiformis]|uniref:Uncharacterized protein n=1 Tax=Cymbomonas tetramitiformis TaxID=36881 RepID=A0AAE0F8C4_9CHLO|nr:hypothetical protein CYMTET_35867 [Cymbomonas tetramitiformis]